MGKYIDFANKCVQRYKPLVEEKTGMGPFRPQKSRQSQTDMK